MSIITIAQCVCVGILVCRIDAQQLADPLLVCPGDFVLNRWSKNYPFAETAPRSAGGNYEHDREA